MWVDVARYSERNKSEKDSNENERKHEALQLDGSVGQTQANWCRSSFLRKYTVHHLPDVGMGSGSDLLPLPSKKQTESEKDEKKHEALQLRCSVAQLLKIM